GGYVVAGYTGSFTVGGIAAGVVKLDANGDVAWQKIYTGTFFGAYPTSIELTADGGYVFAGDLWITGGEANVWVVKLDINGDVVWQRTYGGPAVDVSRNVVPTRDGGYVVAASTGSFRLAGSNAFDVWLLKLDPTGNVVWQR